jgi:hypothetical protein
MIESSAIGDCGDRRSSHRMIESLMIDSSNHRVIAWSVIG